jgi:DNA repair exonuclease SbcCD ATPase subunit
VKALLGFHKQDKKIKHVVDIKKAIEDVNMKSLFVFFCIFMLVQWTGIASAELTKTDIEEIRKIVKEEYQHIDKRIDDIRGEIKDIRSEMKDVRREIKDVRNEIKDVRNEMKDFLLWGFGVTFAGIFALIGFVLWDRRTALSPAIRKNKELEEREERIERVLKEYAIKEPKLAEILKQVGML